MSDKKHSSQDARLQRRKETILESLPDFTAVLRGSFFVRTIRCGKASCRACRDGKGHRVAYVGVTFPGGRTEQITVPKHMVPVVRRQIANYQRWWRAIERVSEINRKLLRERLLVPLPPRSKPHR